MKVEVAYPSDLYHSLKELPLSNVFPCSALFNENIIGGLLFTCSSSDLTFFNINKSNLPQPDLKFRMINSEQRMFLIEFHLYFGSNKILKLHLNPIHQNVRLLFRLLIEKKMISFHFFNKQTNLIASSYTQLDDEEIEWVIRNDDLLTDVKSNMGYLQLADYMADNIGAHERLYKFNGSKSIEQSFIGINQKAVKLLT